MNKVIDCAEHFLRESCCKAIRGATSATRFQTNFKSTKKAPGTGSECQDLDPAAGKVKRQAVRRNDFLKKRLNHFETEILKNQYYNLPTLAAYCGTRYARAQGVMCILSTDPKSPAHAVAVTRQGGKIRFMDPEIGEWMFVTENEFDWWMGKQGNRYTRFSHAHLNYYSVR